MVSALRSASVTEEQVAGAKKQLLSDVYTLMEDPLQLVENMGVQVVIIPSSLRPFSNIDCVSCWCPET